MVLLSLLSTQTAIGEPTESSGDLAQGESWSYTFTEEGVTTFWCSPHPSMNGDVKVVPVGTEGARSGEVNVEMSGYAFSITNLTVEVGTTVTWTNNDAVTHTVELDLEGGDAPESGMMMHDGSMSWTMFWDMAGWWGVLVGLLVLSSVAFTVISVVKSVRRGYDTGPNDELFKRFWR